MNVKWKQKEKWTGMGEGGLKHDKDNKYSLYIHHSILLCHAVFFLYTEKSDMKIGCWSKFLH